METILDQQKNRLDYGALLSPPSGFSLDFAVCLTYSLDLDFLILAFSALTKINNMESSCMKDRTFLLSALQASMGKIAVFCNFESISCPSSSNPLYYLIEDSIFPVPLDKNTNFHPKLWVIRYKDTEDNFRIRVVVLSRNMTFDNSLDIAAEMSGDVSKARADNKRHEPLAQILLFAAAASQKGNKEAMEAKVASLASDVMKVADFDVASPFDSYVFHSLGTQSNSQKSIYDSFTNYEKMVIISPFLSESVIKKLTSGIVKETKLVTRIESLTQKIFKSFNDVYILKDEFVRGDLEEENEKKDSAPPLHDIHAKIYLLSSNKESSLYIGSLNATLNAFYRNTEFMLQLNFAKGQDAYKSFCSSMFDGKYSPFLKLDKVPDAAIQKESEEKNALDEIRKAIIDAEVYLSGDVYDIKVRFNSIKAKAEIAPLFAPQKFMPIKKEVVFRGLPLKCLSIFYVIKIDSFKRVVLIDTLNLPVDKRNNIAYNEIIDSKQTFIKYIDYLFSDDPSKTAMYHNTSSYSPDDKAGSTRKRNIYGALYENMLKSVLVSPDKFENVNTICSNVNNESIPEDFKRLVLLFRKVSRKVR